MALGISPLTSEQIDSVPAGCVIVISSPFNMSNAVYGGLMSTRARAIGAVGTVVDGRFRDLDEQRALDYPVSFLRIVTLFTVMISRPNSIF
jgi:regulator of RNase E activity RraA